MRGRALVALLALAGGIPCGALAAAPRGGEQPGAKDSAAAWSGLALRSIGPSLTPGRVVDLVVDPTRPRVWYAAVASGGVWKTENAGTTWSPVFDGEGSYSIGSLALDPHDPLVVWVGTGENNSQRSVGYGDGVYKSTDGGRTWSNVGLRASEHIGKVLVHPEDGDVVYVAAQGPLWSAGGDRGLFKTTDGGRAWKAVLTISADTGVTDVVLDPRRPDTLYAAAYQRRRHVWTTIHGGPESGLYKSVDGGASWQRLTAGLPEEELGRIGLALSPQDPDTVYALVDAANGAGGLFRSTDGGAHWEKRSDYQPYGPQYYQEIFTDPHREGRLYSMDVFLQVSDDGGRTFRNLGESSKHVDNHHIWIDPADRDHFLVGCDGGIYETFDGARTWKLHDNMPTVQFYKVAVDDARPFYNVYGGTQDNFTLGGPAQTRWQHGILNRDWWVVLNGDGFQVRVDPRDPDVLYAQAQYGELVRFDRRTGEETYIKPQPGPDEAPRWNWDSPLVLSPHSPTRLWFASNRLYRSDDRGDSWRAVSGDLTRNLDRNALPVMGRVWGVDAVGKHHGTSFYGNLVALDESPLVEGLLYVGSDDGLVQASDDGGATWRRAAAAPGVPERAYVRRLLASRHDPRTVYAAFDHHKEGDFAPYLYRSADGGRSWRSIAANLPARGTVYALAEDHRDPRLLFAGTEFGLYATQDGGDTWFRLGGGLPTIQVRDLAIQTREDDLVVGTFGRGIYVLDDYSPLRAPRAVLDEEAHLFAPADAWWFVPAEPLGYRDKSFQGDALYAAANPPFGAVFTYALRDELRGAAAARRQRERELAERKAAVPYPSAEELRAEAAAEDPSVVLTVRDAGGDVVRRLTGPVTAGVHRVAWDLRYPPPDPASLEPAVFENAYSYVPRGPMAAPGEFTVTLELRRDGVATPIGEPRRFLVRTLEGGPAPSAEAAEELEAFVRAVSALQRAASGASRLAAEAADRLALLRRAAFDAPEATPEDLAALGRLEGTLRAVRLALDGDAVMRRLNEPTPPGILDRIDAITTSHWASREAPTRTNRDAYTLAGRLLAAELARLRGLVERDLPELERRLEAAGAPWTPGRVPVWDESGLGATP